MSEHEGGLPGAAAEGSSGASAAVLHFVVPTGLAATLLPLVFVVVTLHVVMALGVVALVMIVPDVLLPVE